MNAPQTGEFAHIGKSVVIKGEVSGSEDLYVDGNVEGNIELRNHSLTVGPNGNVKANVSAKAVVIQGKLDGSVNASDRVDLRKSAVVTGDVTTQRIAIDDAARQDDSIEVRCVGPGKRQVDFEFVRLIVVPEGLHLAIFRRDQNRFRACFVQHLARRPVRRRRHHDQRR